MSFDRSCNSCALYFGLIDITFSLTKSFYFSIGLPILILVLSWCYYLHLLLLQVPPIVEFVTWPFLRLGITSRYFGAIRQSREFSTICLSHFVRRPSRQRKLFKIVCWKCPGARNIFFAKSFLVQPVQVTQFPFWNCIPLGYPWMLSQCTCFYF